jgi:hypothetical protein
MAGIKVNRTTGPEWTAGRRCTPLPLGIIVRLCMAARARVLL